MTYELAKELKEAGFPQDGHFGIDAVGSVGCIGDHPAKMPLVIKVPTLSKLIEACGGKDFMLGQMQREWTATMNELSGRGPTPEEAVARLWLSLHKHA